jgi:hypothetical protein
MSSKDKNIVDNEGLSNEWQENTPVKRELDPWLQRRLEERARPLNSRIQAIEKPALISTAYQKLLRSTGKSNRIVDSILGRVGLTSRKLQADKLPLFSKSFPGSIGRTVISGASGLYRMLNLPWFRPKRGYKPGPVDDSGREVRQEMPGDSDDGLNDTVVLPEIESVEDDRLDRPGKTPETYINYMISSPITRKTIMNIDKQDRDSVNRNRPSLTTGRIAETRNLTGVEKNNRSLSGISRSLDRSAISKEVIPGRSGIRRDDRTTKITGYPSPRSEEKDTGRVAATGEGTKRVETIDYPSPRSEEKNTRQVAATGEGTKRVETIDYPSPRSEERHTGQVAATGEGAERVETIDYPSPHREDRGSRQISATGIEVMKPDISPTSKGNKGNHVYPVMNLFYEKSLPIVRKIVRSLPFSRNIQRREISPDESINQPADQRPAEQNDNYRHLDSPEIVSDHNESPSETPVSADLPELPYIAGFETKDSNVGQEFQDSGNESQAFESQKMNKSAISREKGIKVDTRLAYTAKDLFYRKPLPLTRRLMQSLPIINKIQRSAMLSSVPVKQSTNRSQTDRSDKFKSPENLETADLHEVYARTYEPAQELPLISRAITSKKSKTHRNGSLSGDSSIAGPDFIIPVNNSLDLTLAPVNRMPAVQRQEEYPRIERPPVEPVIARSTQQIQSAETQQSETTGDAATESHENSTGVNESMLDYRTIARETYPFIRRMIMVERERRPSR